jgi:hypothetical protein
MRDPSGPLYQPIVLQTSIHHISTISSGAPEHPTQPHHSIVPHGVRLLRPCTSSSSPDNAGRPERVPTPGVGRGGEKTGRAMARVVERTASASSDISFPEYQVPFGEAQGDNRREEAWQVGLCPAESIEAEPQRCRSTSARESTPMVYARHPQHS